MPLFACEGEHNVGAELGDRAALQASLSLLMSILPNCGTVKNIRRSYFTALIWKSATEDNAGRRDGANLLFL